MMRFVFSPMALIGLIGVVLLAIWSVTTWASFANHTTVTMQVGRQMSAVFREYAHREFRAADLTVRRMLDRLASLDLATACDDRAVWDEAKRLVEEAGTLAGLFVVDAMGMTCINTNTFPSPAVTLHDREYFRHHATGGAGPFVGPAIQARTAEGYRMTISRPIRSGDGQFLGVIIATIDPGSFNDLFAALGLGPGDSAAIYTRTGHLVTRNQLTPAQLERQFSMEKLGLAGLTDIRQFRQTSQADGIERLYTVTPLDDFGVIVTVGRSMSNLYGSWWDRQAVSIIVFLLGTSVSLFLMVQVVRLLRRTAKSEAEARTALADRDTLFSEIHHRVGNNMQVIASFLQIKRLTIGDSAAQQAFDEAIERINVMGLVHRVLYAQKEVSSVDMRAFLSDLAMLLSSSYGIAQKGIAIDVASAKAHLSIQKAVPVGLLANEVITNSLKHAFRDSGGRICISARMDDRAFVLEITDNGVGFDHAAMKRDKGSGLQLIEALARQIDAQMSLAGEGGLRFLLRVPELHHPEDLDPAEAALRTEAKESAPPHV